MDKNFNYLGGYGYGCNEDTALIPNDTIDEKIDKLVGNAPSDMDTIAELAQEVSDLKEAIGGADLSDITEALNNKADKTDVEGLFASVSYENNTITFFDKDGNEVGTIDATNFVKDGMIQNVELNENKELVITFNTDAGAENITVSLAELFEPENYYTKDECDAKFAQTTALNDYSTTEQMNDAISTSASTLTDQINAVNDKVDAIVIPELPENVSAFNNDANYVTASEMETALEGKMDVVELATVATSGSYNDLEDKPEIPSLEGYATTEAMNTALEGKMDTVELATVATSGSYNDLEDKPEIPTVPANVSEFNNDANYVSDSEMESALENKMDVVELATVATSGSYNDLEDKPEIPNLEGYVTTEAMNTALESKMDVVELATVATSGSYNDLEDKPEIPSLEGYATTEAMNTALEGKMDVVELATVATSGSYNDLEDKPEIPSLEGYATTDAMNTALEGKMDTVELATVATSGSYNDLEDKPEIPTVPTNVSEFENDANYVSDSEMESAIEPKADKSSLEEIVIDMSRRLNKLEATNAYLIEHNTDSADDIINMTAEEAAVADITVSSTEAIESLSEPKTFNSISIVGGELGNDTVITLNATDNVNVSGLTVSGEQGNGNGKIIYATNEITIDSVDINPGCTVYNVFEGSQDKNPEHCIDKFTAKNITVNDVDLQHNVFNIYQLNDNAEVTISDSYFNLDVANSNALRLSNITNAKNVTVTFDNVDWTYENKAYSQADLKWAGLVIYQAYGTDTNSTDDDTSTKTWTFNFINCRYNGEHITQNEIGTIKEIIYQYRINGRDCEAPTIFGEINFE